MNDENMATKIEGWVNENQARRGADGYDAGEVILKVYAPTHEDGDEDWNKSATLIIGEKAFTESEVRAIVERIGRAKCPTEALYLWAVHVAKEAGVSFDPA